MRGCPLALSRALAGIRRHHGSWWHSVHRASALSGLGAFSGSGYAAQGLALTLESTSGLGSFCSSTAAVRVSSLRAAMCRAGRRTFPFVP